LTYIRCPNCKKDIADWLIEKHKREADKAKIKLEEGGMQILVPKSWGKAKQEEARKAAIKEIVVMLEKKFSSFKLNAFLKGHGKLTIDYQAGYARAIEDIKKA